MEQNQVLSNTLQADLLKIFIKKNGYLDSSISIYFD